MMSAVPSRVHRVAEAPVADRDRASDPPYPMTAGAAREARVAAQPGRAPTRVHDPPLRCPRPGCSGCWRPSACRPARPSDFHDATHVLDGWPADAPRRGRASPGLMTLSSSRLRSSSGTSSSDCAVEPQQVDGDEAVLGLAARRPSGRAARHRDRPGSREQVSMTVSCASGDDRRAHAVECRLAADDAVDDGVVRPARCAPTAVARRAAPAASVQPSVVDERAPRDASPRTPARRRARGPACRSRTAPRWGRRSRRCAARTRAHGSPGRGSAVRESSAEPSCQGRPGAPLPSAGAARPRGQAEPIISSRSRARASSRARPGHARWRRRAPADRPPGAVRRRAGWADRRPTRQRASTCADAEAAARAEVADLLRRAPCRRVSSSAARWASARSSTWM